MALLYLEQEDAFWCLVTIVEVFMPRDYYTKTLLGSQVRLCCIATWNTSSDPGFLSWEGLANPWPLSVSMHT